MRFGGHQSSSRSTYYDHPSNTSNLYPIKVYAQIILHKHHGLLQHEQHRLSPQNPFPLLLIPRPHTLINLLLKRFQHTSNTITPCISRIRARRSPLCLGTGEDPPHTQRQHQEDVEGHQAARRRAPPICQCCVPGAVRRWRKDAHC
jgi:hypothetical protein